MSIALVDGDRLGPYVIRGVVGNGGMGLVYRAWDPRLGRDVAIKVIADVHASDVDFVRQFGLEARATGALNHPSIVTIFESGSDDGRSYIATEFVDGVTLSEIIGAGRLPLTQVLDIAVQIVDGLSYMHDRGVVHRDLKPTNVMLRHDGRVKIIDFGVGKIVSDSADSESDSTTIHVTRWGPVGSPGYMSPEQVDGVRVDARSDQFAFGSLLYEMLSGQQAFAGDSGFRRMAAVIHEEPLSLTGLLPSVPPDLAQIVHRCLEKKPAARFGHTSELLDALRAVRAGVAGPVATAEGKVAEIDHAASTHGGRSAFQSRPFWRPVLSVGFGVGLIGIVAVGWIGTHRHAPAPPPPSPDPQVATSDIRHSRLEGTVTTSGQPVVAAQVELACEPPCRSRTSATSKSGDFRFDELAPGAYALTVSARGFAQYHSTVSVGDTAQRVTVRLLAEPPSQHSPGQANPGAAGDGPAVDARPGIPAPPAQADARFEPVRVGGDIPAPQPLSVVPPVYPESLRGSRARAVVRLDVTVSHNGAVTATQVVGAPSPFDDAAMTAVRKWIFEPSIVNGTRAPIVTTVAVPFVP